MPEPTLDELGQAVLAAIVRLEESRDKREGADSDRSDALKRYRDALSAERERKA